MYSLEGQDPIEISEDVANHVLWQFGYPGFQPATVIVHVLRAFCQADNEHFGKLAQGFPDYARAVWLMQYSEFGKDELTVIRRSGKAAKL